MKKISSVITAFCLLVSLAFSTGSLKSFAFKSSFGYSVQNIWEYNFEGITYKYYTHNDEAVLFECSQLPDDGALVIPDVVTNDYKHFIVRAIEDCFFTGNSEEYIPGIADDLVSLKTSRLYKENRLWH